MKSTTRLKLGALLLTFSAVLSGSVCGAQSTGTQAAAETRPAERQAEGRTVERANGGEVAEVDENDAYEHSAMVKKFGGMLGMGPDAAAVTFEWLNFAVLAGALGWVMVKTLPKMFRARTSSIQKELTDARTATEVASLRLNSVEERLSHLDEQIAGMKAQAEKDSAADEARIKAQVEEQKKKIVAAAEQEIASASLQAQRQLQKYAAELAIEQAAKRLEISAETDRLLVQEFARRLGAGGQTGGSN